MKKTLIVVASAAVAGLLVAGTWYVSGASKPPESVSMLIDRIRAQPDAEQRVILAERLTRLVQKDPNIVGDQELPRLVALLEDEPARFWIAATLGCLGGRAAGTIPALEAARRSQLQADYRFPVSLSAVATIDVALRKIRASLDGGLPAM